MTGDLWAFYPTSHTIEEIDTCKGLESVEGPHALKVNKNSAIFVFNDPFDYGFLKAMHFNFKTSSPMMTKIGGTFLKNWHLWFLFFLWLYGVGGQKVLVVAETFRHNRS
ncbi:hypothetical protein OSB04_015587, partial [Centaurea solstitialis]